MSLYVKEDPGLSRQERQALEAHLMVRSASLAGACRRQEQGDRRRRLLRPMGTAAAAASVLIAVGIGWIVLQSRGHGQPSRADIAVTQAQYGPERGGR